MYRFIIGPAASGKTYRILKDCIDGSLRDRDSLFVVVVPEQATTETEKKIVSMHPDHATGNIDVLSFNRLAYKVLGELGIEPPEVLDDIGKAMILRKIAADKKDELNIWKNKFDKPGFIENLKSMISELSQYGIRPDDIEKTYREAGPGQLKNKLHDISIVYRAFNEYIRDRFITLEDIPDILAKNIHKSEMIKNATIILDGFTGFTPVQYRIIEGFLVNTKEVRVTVTIGDEENIYKRSDTSELFAMSKNMVAKIVDTASRNSVSHGEDIIVSRYESGVYADNRDLDDLEKHLLRYDGFKSNSGQDFIRIIKALNPKAEAEYIASEIAYAVRHDGLRYRDIAVITADTERYEAALSHELKRSDIPYYQDRNLNLENNAVPELLSSLLETVRTDYSYESVSRLLHTGLITSDIRMMDIIDNYIYECGRRGYKRMSSDWDYLPGSLKGTDLAEINDFKNRVLALLEDLRLLFKEKTAPADKISQQLVSILEKLDVENKMQMFSQSLYDAGETARGREYELCYDKTKELLERMGELLAGEQLSADTFSGILKSGFSQIKLGMIPSGIDRVTIGDITRTRLDDIRLIIVAGANEGNIPKLAGKSAIITDSDKESLKGSGIELSPTIKEDLFIQRYYLYRLFTRAKDKLILTYSGIDASGSAMRPSYILGHISKMFTGVKESDAEDEIRISTVALASGRIASWLRTVRNEGTEKDTDYALFTYLREKEETRERLTSLVAAAFFRYEGDSIGKKTAKALYGEFPVMSFSRLDKFVECPYEHFLKYGIGAQDIKKFSFDAVDIGALAHAAIEKIFNKAEKLGIDLTKVNDEARREMASRCIDEALVDDISSKYMDTSRNAYLVGRIRRIVDRTMWALLYQLSKGDFTYYASEKKFDYKDAPSFRMNLGEFGEIGLAGKVDRIDIYKDDNRTLVKIIDYKTGKTGWDLSDIISGKNMQIVLYMEAIREMLSEGGRKETVPAAMLYYHITDPLISESDISDGDRDAAMRKALLPDGIVNSDIDVIKHLDRDISGPSDVIPAALDGQGVKPGKGVESTEKMELLGKYVKEKIADIGRDMLSGDTNVYPRRSKRPACEYCAYRSACGFDNKISGFRMNIPKRYDNDSAWNEISGNKVD